jgi:hypothetical protein
MLQKSNQNSGIRERLSWNQLDREEGRNMNIFLIIASTLSKGLVIRAQLYSFLDNGGRGHLSSDETSMNLLANTIDTRIPDSFQKTNLSPCSTQEIQDIPKNKDGNIVAK